MTAMPSHTQARARVEALIGRWYPEGDVVVLDDLTIERDWGWMFFYNTRDFIRTGRFEHGLVGNAPIIVNRHSGETIVTGTAETAEHYLELYEQGRLDIPPEA